MHNGILFTLYCANSFGTNHYNILQHYTTCSVFTTVLARIKTTLICFRYFAYKHKFCHIFEHSVYTSLEAVALGNQFELCIIIEYHILSKYIYTAY